MRKYLIILYLFIACTANGQSADSMALQAIHHYIDTLTSPSMHGRGYVQDGRNIAAAYVLQQFKDLKLRPVNKKQSMEQHYMFPINTFPGKMMLTINGNPLKPGDDYLINAASVSYTGNNLPVVIIDLKSMMDKRKFKSAISSFNDQHIYLLQNTDTFCKANDLREYELAALLPKGCYIIPMHTKLTWTVEQDTIAATIFYVKASSIPDNITTVSAAVGAKYLPQSENENIAGYVPGEVRDSFIVFSAHYDHLGMMGDKAYFPGASDNASGTAMLLYLASYFSAHPQHYSILFISFSGEEAGLLGSRYFVSNPMIPLSHIKFLTNIDIMGDATDGVTVVNATVFPKEFSLLNKINDTHKYIPIIKPRGKAANSDHYLFTEKGVPAFFMYSNGGKGFYHDIFDVSNEITLRNVDGVAKLLIDFAEEIR